MDYINDPEPKWTHMPTLSAEDRKKLSGDGQGLVACVRVDKNGLHPLLIENVSSFLARSRLVKIGLVEVETGDRKRIVSSLAASTGSILVGSVGETALLYRVPIFGLKH